MKMLYSAMYQHGYPFDHKFDKLKVVSFPDEMVEQDAALVVWGGSDITPRLYGHKQSITTYSGGRRDLQEWALMKKAVEMGIPIIGICRGAQMLCALSGGYLFQDVSSHAGPNHMVLTSTGERFMTNSIHHQMMCVPEGVEHEVLAWAEERRSTRYIYQDDLEHIPPEKELEYVYFPKTNGFAIQWHPEGMEDDCMATQFIWKTFLERAYSNEPIIS